MKKTEKNGICPQTNPGNCRYLNTLTYCAFAREDRKCKKRGKKKKKAPKNK